MPVFRYFVCAGPALLALLVIINAVFGEGPPRFTDAIYNSALYAPRADTRSMRPQSGVDATPADRVKGVFGQFSANDSKRLKRYSSASSTI